MYIFVLMYKNKFHNLIMDEGVVSRR